MRHPVVGTRLINEMEAPFDSGKVYMAHKYPATNRRAVKAYAARSSETIRQAKNVPCADCGNKYPYYVMQFDHQDNKFKNVSAMTTYSKARLLSEISKCEVVCANCHAERTFKRRNGVLAQLGSAGSLQEQG